VLREAVSRLCSRDTPKGEPHVASVSYAALVTGMALTFGDYQLITLEVNDVDWRAITSNHRPGAVVRLQALADKPDTSRSSMSMARSWAARRPLEQPLALANLLPLGVDDGTALPKTSVGELEVLVGLPDSHLNPEVTELLYRLRELPAATHLRSRCSLC